jgi:hypothetical protein
MPNQRSPCSHEMHNGMWALAQSGPNRGEARGIIECLDHNRVFGLCRQRTHAKAFATLLHQREMLRHYPGVPSEAQRKEELDARRVPCRRHCSSRLVGSIPEGPPGSISSNSPPSSGKQFPKVSL